MNWKSIRLELGSTGEFPAGSISRVYLVRLPLDDHDQVDKAELLERPARATVRRHWASEADELGSVVKVDGHWAMRCDGKPDRTIKFDSRPVRLGEEISVIEANGTVLPFRIASVR